MRHLIARVSRRLLPPSETLDYQHEEVADVVFRKTIAFFPVHKWTGVPDGSSVLDFGGGCGLHYKQAQLPNARWAVVETPVMVERAKQLSTDKLQFFTSIRSAADWLGHVDLVYSDGALHYTPNPSEILAELCALGAANMRWRRTWLSKLDEVESGIQYSILEDNGPGSIEGVARKRVACPFIKMPESEFLSAHQDYCLTSRGLDWFKFRLS